ncbi:MAG TPA: hypothetical protein DCX46_02415 [Bacteroidetes bacterium]|nr:hypothetical protein [Bacteroidota bacterium]
MYIMNISVNRSLCGATISLVVVLFFGGCALAGFGVGSLIDTTAPDTVTVSREAFQTLRPGLGVEITDNAGRTRSLVVVRSVLEDAATNRANLLASCAAQNGPNPPLTLDTVRVVVDSRTFADVQFAGYSKDGIWLQFQSFRGPVHIAWHRLDGIRTVNGRVWTAEELRSIVEKRLMPARNGIIVRKSVQPRSAALEDSFRPNEFIRSTDIVAIRAENDPNNSWWWALGGFAVDVIVFASLRHVF